MSWPEINKLKSILAQSVLQCQKKPDGSYECDASRAGRLLESHSSLVLQETGKGAALRTMPLDGVSPDGLCIKLDNFGIRCFKKDTGNKACDYLVLTEDSHKKFALFIELKTSLSATPDKNGYLSLTNEDDRGKALQLNSGTSRFEYICSVIETLYGTNMFHDYVKKHYVLYLDVKNLKPTQTCIQPTGAMSFKYTRILAINVTHKTRLTVGDLLTA